MQREVRHGRTAARVRIIELAGIGPGPFAAMMLADMGAEVVRVDRARARATAPPGPATATCCNRGRRVGRHRPQAPRRRRGVARARRAGRRADRGLPARRDGAARPRPRRVPRPQPEARVRAHDGLGPGRALRAGGRPRHQLHRARPAPSPTSAAPARRRRRRSTWSATSAAAACSSPSASCAACSRRSAVGPGPGGRRRHGRRRGRADDHVPRRSRQLGMLRREQRGANLLDTGAHFYDVVRVRRREVRLDRLDRAAVLRRAAPPHRARRTTPSSPSQLDQAQWPAPEGAPRRTSSAAKTRDEWCALMEGTDVCFAPVLTMSEAAAHPHNVDRGTFVEVDGVAPAGARAAVQPHDAPRSPARRPTPGQHTARGARRLGRRRSDRRQVVRSRRDSLAIG